MQYILFIATDPEGETIDEHPEAWVEHWNARGVRLEGMPLTPPGETKTIRVRGEEVLVTDGPYAETTEWIAGYDLIEAADLDEAIEVARTHPMATAGRIEIRPVDASHDLGPGTENPPRSADVPASRFQVLFRMDPAAEPPYDFPQSDVAEWVREGFASGAYGGGHHLAHVDDATLVRVRGGEVLVTDGPYAEVAEWITGFSYIDGSWDEAIEYVALAPMARSGIAELREFWRDC